VANDSSFVIGMLHCVAAAAIIGTRYSLENNPSSSSTEPRSFVDIINDYTKSSDEKVMASIEKLVGKDGALLSQKPFAFWLGKVTLICLDETGDTKHRRLIRV